ncbi:probable plastid-lipid-associated protein 10, chloroplastic isoform X2 [Telopea speciosissima]|uniref:probable plastid-lipid-associated protein 10, chloroplastic isoform X2 n=1 Tax=Telopea speciosissima TaxID=54955 RepID=UPI001CC66F5F|nr:probable plastid-lipid-associated protein 10, chloroplastic isoform X2 [Telopea speciosissima]
MDLTIRSFLSFPLAGGAINEKRLSVATPCSTTKHATPGTFLCTATASIATDTTPFERESQKHNLLRAIQDTQRGLVATSDKRYSIEEALVCVEAYDAGSPIDLVKLDGTWRLQYTSAPDVLVLLESAARIPFFQVGQIYQTFDCRDNSDGGIVQNVVRWSIPSLLEVAIQNINISEELQAVIAPAILPRTFQSLQILQFIRGFRAQVPLRSSKRQSVGGLYYLSYLDGNMLLGRAVGGGGVFVFTKAQPLT